MKTAKYKILFRDSVSKDFKLIPKKDCSKIIEKIENLSENPRPVNSTKLFGEEKYRIRHGNYRIIYEIKDEVLVITIVKVAHRKNVYRKN